MKIISPKIEAEKYDGIKIMKNIERAMRVCYRSEGLTTEDSYKRLLKIAVSSGHESVMEHEKISVRIQCSLNFYKDITRHRTGVAFSIESTRWINYSKDKFNSELKFLDPVYITNPENYNIWKNTMAKIEDSIAAEVAMTCNIREWRHILKLRTSNRVHPEIRQIFIPLLLKFKADMPELFEDIEYDTEFPKEWYAEITDMED